MDLSIFFKSIVDSDMQAVVVCDINHQIIYMNPAAVSRYHKRGGADLVGKSLLDCHNEHSQEMIKKVTSWFAASTENNRMFTYHNPKENRDVYMIALRDENKALIGYYEKHESRVSDSSEPYAGINS